jgi:hypothetical protein
MFRSILAVESDLEVFQMSDVKPISVYYSYAYEDEALIEQLMTHLQVLQRLGIISSWHKRNISAGVDWTDEADKHLQDDIHQLIKRLQK